MNVLYLDGVGPFGGASRSLFEAVRALSELGIAPYFVVARGTALDFYSKVATDFIATRGLTRFDNTEYSHYRGLRWLVLLREVFHLPFTFVALFRAKRRWGGRIDLIHVNEVTEIIPGLIARALFRVPLVVHVRSPQRSNSNSNRSRWLHRQLANRVDAVIAIDETTRGTLPQSLTVSVIHNSFTASASANPDAELMSRFGRLRRSSLKVGFVGNLHVSKGVFDLVESARILKESNADVEFVLVGGHTRVAVGLRGMLLKAAGLQQDVYQELIARIERYGLQGHVHLFGATTDIQSVYERIDVIAFPSHFDAPGRPVFEAAFSAVPCIACVSNPTPDTLVNDETGLTVPARDPHALAAAIRHFETDRSEVKRMGDNARELAHQNFDPGRNAARIRALYAKVVGRAALGRGSRRVHKDGFQ